MYSVKNLYDVPLRIPVQTIFNVNGGVVALSMSSDAKYIVAIGARTPQIVSRSLLRGLLPFSEYSSGQITISSHVFKMSDF